jgi:hypothetical protein
MASAGAFSVDEWHLSCMVYEGSSGGHDSASFSAVQNPFMDEQTASFSDSDSYTSYDFCWGDQFATFSIQSSQHAEGVSSSVLFTASSGFMYVTPSVDLLFSVDGAFDYDLPADFMMAIFGFDITDPVEQVEWFGAGQTAETFPGQPASGTLPMEGSVVLPAGHTWQLHYNMELMTFSGTQGHMATGEGDLTFTLTALPEPATLVLLAPAILAARRHRPR